MVMWMIAIPIGIYSATHQYSWGDVGLTTMGFLGLSIPDFMLGLIYLFVGVFVFNAPVGGLVSPAMEDAPWSPAKVLDLANHLLWPTLILAAAGTAQLIRIMRGNLLDILGQQFVTTARAKGLPESTVVNKYATRVAINPRGRQRMIATIAKPDLGRPSWHRAQPADHRHAVPARAVEPGHLPGGTFC